MIPTKQELGTVDWDAITVQLAAEEGYLETAGPSSKDQDYWNMHENRMVLLSAVQILTIPVRGPSRAMVTDSSAIFESFFIYVEGHSKKKVLVLDRESHLIDERFLVGEGLDEIEEIYRLAVANLFAEKAICVDADSLYLVKTDGTKEGPVTLRPLPWINDGTTRRDELEEAQGVKNPIEHVPWLNDVATQLTKPVKVIPVLDTNFDFGFD